MKLTTTLRFTIICFFFILAEFELLGLSEASRGGSARAQVPALIAFGDSIVDPGNNNDIPNSIKCNFPPYGVDFVGHKPTGRFCNGKIPTDFIASKLGIKEYLPAYVGTNLSAEDLVTGVSFASGGAGFDPLTSLLVSAISMDQQLDLFKEYKEKVKAIVGEERASVIVSESIYVVCVGSDDIANTYFLTLFRRTHYDIPSYADLVVGFASDFVQKLVNLGARKVIINGIPPIGCVPSQRTLAGGLFRDCSAPHNQLANLFNSRFNSELQSLQPKLSGTKLILVDIYSILYDIIQRPTNYGFEISTKGCCGTGEIEVSTLCNSKTTCICSDVSKYVFWDSYHPTQKAYKMLVDYMYEEYFPQLF